ncbi:MAG: N-acetylmuramoyl-L-alanine amidase [Planctomycetes bacterium]|nr:N-acetylmuramoyl-L-alanine amidase [Planctomycetota bacterium]
MLVPAPAKSFACLVLALALLAAHGCVAPAEHVTSAPIASSSRYACLNDVARRLNARVSVDDLSGVFAMQVGERRAAVAPGVAAAAIGARLVSLHDEVVVRYGRVYVPRWLAYEIEAYLQGRIEERPQAGGVKPTQDPKDPEPVKQRVVGRVCIDPGHGGKDPGAISRWGLHEKDVVLPTAFLLAAELRAKGFDVRMTRESDVFVELEDRPAVASRTNCDIFVSVHANAMRDASYRGLEIFYWSGSWSAASTAVRREGVELAEAIERACQRAGLSVRSVRGADYKVLRFSRVPATLVELGFLTNRAEEQALRTTAYRQRLVRAIADGIVAYKAGARN